MLDPKQLHTLEDLERKKVDEASVELARMRRGHSAAQSQLTLLNGYLADYQTQLQSGTGGGLDADSLRNFQRFLSNISEAIERQAREVRNWEAALARAETSWREHYQKLHSYKALVQRGDLAQRAAEERRLQKQNDEFSQRAGSRANSLF